MEEMEGENFHKDEDCSQAHGCLQLQRPPSWRLSERFTPAFPRPPMRSC